MKRTLLPVLGSLGLGLFLACGGASQPPPVAAASAPGGTKNQAAWPVDDKSMCDWRNKPELEVSETAGPGSVKPNIRRVFKIVGEGDDRHKALVCREIETNLDGIKDVVRTFNAKGEAVREEADTNYDGKIDVWLQFSNGRVIEEDSDPVGDGKPHVWKAYANGQLSRIKRDTKGTGKADVWEIYTKGRLERMGVDQSGDGRVDLWERDGIYQKQLEAEDDAQRAAAAGDAGATTGGGPWSVALSAASCALLRAAVGLGAMGTRGARGGSSGHPMHQHGAALLAAATQPFLGAASGPLRAVTRLLATADAGQALALGATDVQASARLLALHAVAAALSPAVEGEEDEDGSNHENDAAAGPRLAGVLDGALELLVAVGDHAPALWRGAQALPLAEVVCRQLQVAGSGEVGPRGAGRALRLLAAACWAGAPRQLASSSSSSSSYSYLAAAATAGTGGEAAADPREHVRTVLQLAHREGLAGLLTLVCLPQHALLCGAWGGAGALDDVLVAVCDVLRCLLAFISSPLAESAAAGSAAASAGDALLASPTGKVAAAAADTHSQKILEGVYRTQLVGCLLQVLRQHRPGDGGGGRGMSARAAAAMVHVLSELVLTSSKFMAQFVESRGLEAVVDLPFLAPDAPAPAPFSSSFSSSSRSSGERDAGAEQQQVVVCLLQIASHLARHSEKHFDALGAVFDPARLVALLSHRHAAARAKCCNLVGNLCRHSGRCYPALAAVALAPDRTATTSPLALLTACCADDDPATRKFACFAVGNAAFHSAELYGALAGSIAPLARASETEADEKTRANAVGAIGNLVRNGGALARDMVRARVPLLLLKMVLVETDVATQRIALFSLGTMAVYASCRDALLTAAGPSAAEVVKIVRDTSRDETVLKYLARFRQKLKQPLQPEGGEE